MNAISLADKESIMQMFKRVTESPLGGLLLVTDMAQHVRALDFADHRARLQRGLRAHYGIVDLTEIPPPAEIAQAIARYFGDGGARRPAHIDGGLGAPAPPRCAAYPRERPRAMASWPGTGFRRSPAAIDIGAANGANPIAIVVPCHRVIASNGDLKGYAGACTASAGSWNTKGRSCQRAPKRGPPCCRGCDLDR